MKRNWAFWGLNMRGNKEKVRDIYEVSDDKLVIVTSDRISAFDVVLPKPVKGKGKVLNTLSLFWFDFTKNIVPNHIISADLNDMPEFFRKEEFEGRTVLVKKLKMLPFECIVRGYMFGQAWETQPGNYKLAEKLEAPIFTPAIKAEKDVYVPFDAMEKELGSQLAGKMKNISFELYTSCFSYACERGIIIADAKFEFGLDKNGELTLADEIFTPDSSRMWDLAEYRVNCSPKSYDKQFIRDWISENRTSEKIPDIPDEIISKTAAIYAECLKKLTE